MIFPGRCGLNGADFYSQASDIGSQIGDAVGKATMEAFDEGWTQF